jgi:DNA polymerase-1
MFSPPPLRRMGLLTSAQHEELMHFERLNTAEEVEALITWHNTNSKYVVLDLETTGLDPFTDKITDVVISGIKPASSCVFHAVFLEQVNCLRVHTLILHNFRFDYRMLYHSGVDLRKVSTVRDTMLLHHLTNPDAVSHALDSIIQEEYQDDYKERFWSKYSSYGEASEEDKLEYACKDVVYTGLIYKLLNKRLADMGIPESLVDHVHRLALALYNTELEGVRVDTAYLTEVGVELGTAINAMLPEMRASAETQIRQLELDSWLALMETKVRPETKARVACPVFNWSSPKQLADLIYHRLKLSPQYNKRNLTCDDEALSKIEHEHVLIPKMREWRTLQKMQTSFVEGVTEKLKNGRIHPSLNVNGTKTGRISCSEPNLQQMPSYKPWSKIRGIFIPDAGTELLTCDYKQLEVVVAAHFSMDKALLSIVLEGASQHDITANSLKVERSVAKTINFSMQYGCTPYKTKQILQCSDAEAKYIWNKYWETYPGLKKVIDECGALVDAGKPIVTPFGRRRLFPTKFDQAWQKESAKRQAFSTLIQGTGADLTHVAFYQVSENLSQTKRGRALFEVHDEIVALSKRGCYSEVKQLVETTMVKVGRDINLRVPLTVDCSGPLERWNK